ncbi:hypothetical protein GCM10022290_36470 [Sagittula marina]
MNSVLFGSCRVSSMALSAIVLIGAESGTATADNLQEVGGIVARPYPYKLLGLQPGDPVDDLTALFNERSEAAPTQTERRLRIQSPQGKAFDLRYEATREIGDIGMQGRLANAPQDHITAFLATEAFGKRPLALFRVLKVPTEKAPEPAALRAQMEDLYGLPSMVEMQGQSMTLIYAWGTDGFITDLGGQPVQTFIEDLGGNRTSERQFRTCAAGGPFNAAVEYAFKSPRVAEDAIMPDCVATYEITYQGGPEISTIKFALKDYELARLHQAETDGQIMEALSSPTSQSDMDL